MHAARIITNTTAALVAFSCATAGFAQVAFTDSQGRQWRQVDSTTGHTWNAVAAVCPTDGVTPCSGVLGAVQVDGWVWATQDDVLELFAEFKRLVHVGMLLITGIFRAVLFVFSDICDAAAAAAVVGC